MIYINTWQDAMEKKSRPKHRSPDLKRVGRAAADETVIAPLPVGLKKATLFMNGRSQAVRLPKEFRFEGTHVYARKEGNRVILSAVDDRWENFLAAFGSAPDFPDRDQGKPQEGPELDALFDVSA